MLENVANGASNAITKVEADFGPQRPGYSQHLWNAMYAMSTGANDLSNALSNLASYSAGMSTTPGSFVSNFKHAEAGWNGPVRTIWRLANEKNPPNILLGSSASDQLQSVQPADDVAAAATGMEPAVEGHCGRTGAAVLTCCTAAPVVGQ